MATPERVRLFVALELPSRMRSALDAWRRDAVGARDDLRLVAASSLHVTLAFLGSRAAGEVDEIAAAVSAPNRASAPSAIASATCGDTAPCDAINPGSTPSSDDLASFEYETTPPAT